AEIKELKLAILADPASAMHIYLKTINEEVLLEPLCSRLRPSCTFHCSCSESDDTPCKHLVATVFDFAMEIEQDPTQLLRVQGIPWDRLLKEVHQGVPVIEVESEVSYSMTPLPQQQQFQSTRGREMEAPPFWISPFPFPLIMEEIYLKTKQTQDDDQDE